MAPGRCSSALLLVLLWLHSSIARHVGPWVMQDTKLWEEPSSNASVERFSKVLQFNTVSDPTQKLHVRHPEAFQQLDAFLRDSYPRVFSTLTVEKVGEGRLSFLITWNGTVPRLNPALFISHQDVVPVTPGTEKDWTYPPFSGAIAEGYVWGRGAMDVKIGVVGLLEAAEQLLAEGFTPQRTVMFAFGQDEEVGGGYGAGEIAKLLHKRGVKVDIVQDEGGGISRDGCPPFTTHPLALIGTAEKGYATWQVKVSATGGHSSRPPIDGSSIASIFARVLRHLDSNPPPTRLVEPVTEFLTQIAPHARGWWQPVLVAAHFENLRPWVAAILSVFSPTLAALVRTTVAVTRVKAGVADNVLPQSGSLGVNFRMLQGDGEDALHSYLAGAVNRRDQSHVSIHRDPASEDASQVTNSSGVHFLALKQAIQEVWSIEGVQPAVVPFMMTGSTDSKHYAHLTENGILRFTAVSSNETDVRGVHGTNERCRVEDVCKAIATYKRAIELLSSIVPPASSGSSTTSSTSTSTSTSTTTTTSKSTSSSVNIDAASHSTVN